MKTLMHRSRQSFYNAGGPWYRCRLVEAVGSQRFAQSNTYFLERHRGWSGVLVEPIPELRSKRERRRPAVQVFGCALVDATSPDDAAATKMVTMHFCDLTSTMRDAAAAQGGLAVTAREPRSVSVPGRSISSVLEEAGLHGLDLMVLDLEGYELDALRGLDLRRWAPQYILVDALDRADQQPALDMTLASHYDFAEERSDYDLLYRRRG